MFRKGFLRLSEACCFSTAAVICALELFYKCHCITADCKLLVSRDHCNLNLGISTGNYNFLAHSLVRLSVDCNTKVSKIGANFLTDHANVLTDTSGKYDCVNTVHSCYIAANVFCNAVEQMYNVVVTDVNTVNYMGKLKSRYTKAGLLEGRANNFKKAIVTLKDGDKIDFYSNI